MTASVGLATGNAGCRWDEFDPAWYVEANYRALRDDDRRILQMVRDFFASASDPGRPVARGIDVGSGANLYPALSMLPFCRQVSLCERGRANVAWLTREVQWFSSLWEPYWDQLTSRKAYRHVDQPREVLRERAVVRPGDLFQLPRRQWDIGTMFFVAESISDQEREFKLAVERFVGSLKTGAPFAAAFMEDSEGYFVDKLRFPAVAVSATDVAHCLSALVDEFEVKQVRSARPLRDGYHGMILALGKAGKTRP